MNNVSSLDHKATLVRVHCHTLILRQTEGIKQEVDVEFKGLSGCITVKHNIRRVMPPMIAARERVRDTRPAPAAPIICGFQNA